MLNDLEKCFMEYIEEVRKELNYTREELGQERVYQLVKNENYRIMQSVNKLEEGDKFWELAEEFRKAFPESPSKKIVDRYYKEQEMYEVNFNIHYFMAKNFFRRSGFYNSFTSNKIIANNELFNVFITTINRNHQEVKYLLPMVEVYLKKDSMNFNNFKIVRFKPEELSDLFTIEINRTFYPNAVFNVKDLSGAFYIVVDETEKLDDLLKSGRQDLPDKTYEFKLTKYSIKTEQALSSIVLYDFVKRHKQREPRKKPDRIDSMDKTPDQIDLSKLQENIRDLKNEDKIEDTGDFSNVGLDEFMRLHAFDVPWILKVTDNLLLPPESLPLATQSGLEVNPYGHDFYTFHKKYTDVFIEFVSETEHLLNRMQNEEVQQWYFFDLALGCFLKGFFAPEYEQILWHVIALESLLGDIPNTTETIARRISLILGKNTTEQDEIRKSFKSLYEFRCNLVHGKKDTKKPVKLVFHKTALDYTRKTILWFLHFLNSILDVYSENQGEFRLPNRQNILDVIDLDRGSKDLMKTLGSTIPENFPHVREWVE